MGLSDLFVDPESLPEGGYGLVQLCTLLGGYAYVLYVASNMISDGSELLLLIPSVAGIVGSCVLPVLGAVPDGMIVLFSGLGPDAQEQLDVGVGALAGSTIMLITLPWVLSLYAGRVNIVDEKPDYSKHGKAATGAVTGVPNSPNVNQGGIIMMITSISYILLQGPAFYLESKGEKQSEVAQGEKIFALAGLFTCLFFFFGYLYYQWRLSVNDGDEVAERTHVRMIIKNIEADKVTLRGALYYELQEYGRVSGSYTENKAARKFTEYPEKFQKRFVEIIKHFWRHFDFKGKTKKQVDLNQLNILFMNMKESVSNEKLQALFEQFDTDHNGSVDFDEFTAGCVEWLLSKEETSTAAHGETTRLLQYQDAQLSTSKSDVEDGNDDEDEDEEEVEMPSDLATLAPEEQQRQLLSRSFTTMGLGTLLVILFSDPMTDALGNLGTRLGVRPFYVSFVLAPLASNASELIASYNYALKKTPTSISIALQALQGAACMNNTFCLAIFMALIYVKGLAWEYSAETLAIVFCQFIIALVSLKKLQTMFDGVCIVMVYPLCLAMVALLEAWGLD